jgi:lipopolysaccharide/colanic/teichoic acid biosynthesis glycosyltransferase
MSAELGFGVARASRQPPLSRALDLVIATVALALLSPVLALCALVIVIDAGMPVFYSQERVGHGGRTFRMRKLRTMRPGSEPRGPHDPVGDGDARVTRSGAFLRRYSLDEIPNLVNVLRGEMAIVGPRPTISSQVVDYTPRQLRRLEVLPGITGWAQVNGRAGIPWSERIELDVWYVEHRSLGLDLKILARTAKQLLTPGEGIYEQ